MDYTVHGILQARILEWVVIPFSRGSSQPRDQTQVSRIAGRFFISLSRERMFLGSLSCHNKDLEWRTLKPPRHVTALRSWIDRVIALRSQKDHVIALRQISVTALFYLDDSRKIHLQGVRARRSKDTRRRVPQARERERELALAPLFICLSLPGPVPRKLGQPGVLFVLPEVLTPVLGLSFVLFSRLFPSLSFSHCHFGLLFPILPT